MHLRIVLGMNTELHEALSIARKRAGLTQVELAKLAGVAHTTIVRMESGAHVPTQTYGRLFKVLGLKVTEDKAEAAGE